MVLVLLLWWFIVQKPVLCEIEPKMLFVFLMMWSVVEVRLTRTCLEVTLGMILTKNKITIISFWVVCKRMVWNGKYIVAICY